MSNMTSSKKEKFRISAGITAMMGTIKAVMYKLFGQKRPLARFGKSFVSPSLAAHLLYFFKHTCLFIFINIVPMKIFAIHRNINSWW